MHVQIADQPPKRASDPPPTFRSGKIFQETAWYIHWKAVASAKTGIEQTGPE